MPWFAFTVVISCIFFVVAPAVPPSPLLLSSGPGLPVACPPSPPPLVARAAYCPPYHLCSWPWQCSDRAGKACGPHPLIHRCVCVHGGVRVVSPQAAPLVVPDLGPRLL